MASSGTPPRALARDLESRPLVRSLACRGCKYDLRGLTLASECPECGQPVWDSVLSAVDPAARSMPEIHSPRLVGTALVLFVACVLMAFVSAAMRPLADMLAFLVTPPSWMRSPVWALVGGCAILLALLSPIALWPRKGRVAEPPVRRHLVAMAAGLAAGGGLLLLRRPIGRDWATNLALVVVLGLTMLAYRRVLIVAGERSRQFRTAGGNRQRILDLVAAAGVLAVGEALRGYGRWQGSQVLPLFGTVLVGVSGCMLLIGLVYLLVNTTWVRRALIQPPPSLRELIGEDGDPAAPPAA